MKKLIIANWKNSATDSQIKKFRELFVNPNKAKTDAVIAAPFVYLTKSQSNKYISGAQNVSIYGQGAYTGEISAESLKELGVKYCLIGHSERRIYFQENNKTINQKINQLLANKIIPVLCIGETAGERKRGLTVKVLTKQIIEGLSGVKDVSKMVIAYEPVWAISTFQKGKNKVSATEAQIATIHSWLRQFLIKKFSGSGKKIKLLYGGSVNPENSKNFLNFPDVDGALVGAASLEAKSFMAIINNIK